MTRASRPPSPSRRAVLGTLGALGGATVACKSIPQGLEDAMSRRAQAERERQARIILSGAEVEIADSFAAAATRYHHDPIALQLRSLNLLYEGMKERGSLMVVPSSMSDSMGVGTFADLAALSQQTGAPTAPPAPTRPPMSGGGDGSGNGR